MSMFTCHASIFAGIFVGLTAASVCTGAGYIIPQSHSALIDPYWVFSTDARVPGYIQIGDQDYSVARSVDLGEARLIRLASPAIEGSAIQRAYHLESYKIPSLFGLLPGVLVYGDSLLGSKGREDNELVGLDNDKINAEIIKDALLEGTSPFLGQLPHELHSHIISFGNPDSWKGVSRYLAGLARSVPVTELTLNNHEEVVKLLEAGSATPIHRVKITFSITAEDLIPLLANHPEITHLYVSNCHHLMDRDIFSKYPNLIHKVLRVAINTREDLRKLLASEHPITRVILYEDRVTDKDVEDICKHCPNLSELEICRCNMINGSFFQHLPKESLAKLVLYGYGGNFPTLKDFARLKKLGLSTCIIDNTALHSLPKSIVQLDLRGTPVSNFSALKELPELAELDLSYCKGVSDGIFGQLPSSLTKLTLANIQITHLSDLKQLSCLKELNLTRCFGLELESVPLEDFPETLMVLGHDMFCRPQGGILDQLEGRNREFKSVYKGRNCFPTSRGN